MAIVFIFFLLFYLFFYFLFAFYYGFKFCDWEYWDRLKAIKFLVKIEFYFYPQSWWYITKGMLNLCIFILFWKKNLFTISSLQKKKKCLSKNIYSRWLSRPSRFLKLYLKINRQNIHNKKNRNAMRFDCILYDWCVVVLIYRKLVDFEGFFKMNELIVYCRDENIYTKNSFKLHYDVDINKKYIFKTTTLYKNYGKSYMQLYYLKIRNTRNVKNW